MANFPYTSGYREDCVSAAKEEWLKIMLSVQEAGCPTPPPPKVFKPKHGLPALADYRGKAPPGYWEKFPKCGKYPGKSWIDPVKLMLLAKEHGVQGERLDKAMQDLRHGADIGCKGAARGPTRSTNAPSAYEFGPQVSDAIADWVVKGLAYGPVKEEDLPRDVKVNGIMCKEKPNGSVRIINNLSSPAGKSVNDGIDKADFPAVMSSTPKFVKAINVEGKDGYIMKIDWESAYKHIAVRPQDLHLQWFKWMDRYFVELSLIFGGVSSVGIYDRHAKLVLDLVLAATSFPRAQVCQHLDDVPAAGSLKELLAFDDAYYAIAGELGVRLAPRDDPEKAFAPSKSGIVFGVLYDTATWTWAVPKERLTRLLVALHDLLDRDVLPAHAVESVAGKIIHVRPLVPGGRFHVDQILCAVAQVRRGALSVAMTPLLRSQLHFWSLLLPTCSGRTAIPNLEKGPPSWAVDYYTDAAGGCMRTAGHGLGGVGPGWWAYTPWSRYINNVDNRDSIGKSFSQKLSLLELLGPLLVVSAGAAACKGQDIRIWVDNIGAVIIYRKGYCTECPITSSVARAINVVSAGIGCRVYVVKIRRCSNRESVMADALSKAAFRHFVNLWEGPLPDASPVPRSLLQWMQKPVDDPALGDRILSEVQSLEA
jgi:hypothetical protein